MTSDGRPYHRVRYKQIVEEQVTLSYLTKGGVTYGDSEEMTPYERKIALDTMTEIINAQNGEADKMKRQSEMEKKNYSPRSGMTK